MKKTNNEKPVLELMNSQVDEVIVQAIEVNYKNNKTISKEGKTQIESFSRVLSDMLSSLEVKPYPTLFFILHFFYRQMLVFDC